ncbi:hypothetical protein [Natrinema hispanicum]|uniref:Uncharacterized protein n=1 Tax=Natrinema hispanicum TaxID=392421 RepID=A0A1I0IVT5_9EURY|nr:hypothetical protein [Natrinema hispanicum]SEU00710.1 hypothetical protein SAMN04488694_1262 [Natrinema hispanicum]
MTANTAQNQERTDVNHLECGHGDDERDGSIPPEALGNGDLYIDVDRETYERLRLAYENLVVHGYRESFCDFAVNYTQTGNAYVTVDGAPVNPNMPLEAVEDGDTEVSEE